MTTDNVSVPTATAVFIGAAVLVGAPVTVLVMGFLGALLDTLGVSITLGTGLVDLFVVLGMIGLFLWVWAQISYEAAQLQLYGVAGLSRGPRWAVIARHLTLGVIVLIALVVVIFWAFLFVLAASSLLEVVIGLATGLAGLAVLFRAWGALYEGMFGLRLS